MHSGRECGMASSCSKSIVPRLLLPGSGNGSPGHWKTTLANVCPESFPSNHAATVSRCIGGSCSGQLGRASYNNLDFIALLLGQAPSLTFCIPGTRAFLYPRPVGWPGIDY